MTKECQTCRYWHKDELGDGVCCNGDSHSCADYMDADNCCRKWEGDGV